MLNYLNRKLIVILIVRLFLIFKKKKAHQHINYMPVAMVTLLLSLSRKAFPCTVAYK